MHLAFSVHLIHEISYNLLIVYISYLQLELLPPPEVMPVLAAQCSDAELDGYILSAAKKAAAQGGAAVHDAYDVMGVAAVACLVQMAVTANTDVFWKPLNHRVLMSTRGSASVRTRLLALEVVVQLVERLREEYLVLLPEVRGWGKDVCSGYQAPH